MSSGALEGLGVVGSRRLGCPGSQVRLSDPFPITSSSLQCSDSTSQLQPQFHQGAGFVRCGVHASGKGGHRDRASFAGVLQSPICYSQSHRGLATGHRPLTPQRLGGPLQFSYEDCPVGSPVSPSGRLDGVLGSPGRLPPGSCTSGFSPLPEVLRGRCGVSVYDPMLRPVVRSSSVHSRHGSYLFHHASPRFSSSPLSRRLAGPGLHLPGPGACEGLPPLAMSSPRSHSKSFEELFGSDSDFRLSRDDSRDFSFEGFPDPQTGPKALSSSPSVLLRPSSTSVGLAQSPRHDVLHVYHSSGFTSPYAISSALPQCSRSSSPRPSACFLGRHLPLRWWSDDSRLLVGFYLGDYLPDLCLFSDASDQGWGAALGDLHLSGLWSSLCSSFSINQRELLTILFAIRGFLPHLRGQTVAVYSDNSTALAYLRKQGGTHSSSLNEVAQVLLRLCEDQSVRLLPQFIPGHLNVLADSLSRRSQVLGSEWTLCHQAFAELLRRWPATIDLFATAMTHRLPVYFSPMFDPMSVGTDAMLQSWDGLQAYAFPPFSLIPRFLAKVRASRNLELTLVAPFWPQHLWFPDLLELLLEIPLFLPKWKDLLRQPHLHRFHQQLSMLRLTAFRISSDPHVRQASLTRWLVNLPAVDAVPPVSTTKPSG